jgi:hypothetical protein
MRGPDNGVGKRRRQGVLQTHGKQEQATGFASTVTGCKKARIAGIEISIPTGMELMKRSFTLEMIPMRKLEKRHQTKTQG